MSVLVKPAGGEDSGDEMMEVLVVGLGSVEKSQLIGQQKVGLQGNHHFEDNSAVLVGTERAECRFFRFVARGGNFECEILESTQTLY